MPSQSRVHIGPLETSFSPRPEAEMLMRSWWETKGAGGREGRQTVLPYRFLLRRNRCSAPTSGFERDELSIFPVTIGSIGSDRSIGYRTNADKGIFPFRNVGKMSIGRASTLCMCRAHTTRWMKIFNAETKKRTQRGFSRDRAEIFF